MIQLCIWVHYVSHDLKIHNELLELKELSLTTKSEDVYSALLQVLDEFSMNISNIVAITTDSAAAMTGRLNGLTTKLRNHNENLISLKCIIHQEALCTKLGIKPAKEFSDEVMVIVNTLISKGATRHRAFNKFLEENDSSIKAVLVLIYDLY